MFNLFNLGHALPLRVRRFSCCTALHAIQRACEMLTCIHSFTARPSIVGTTQQPCAFALCDASLLEVRRRVLRVHCQCYFIVYEGHHDPA
jgi:hypothetical protein